MGTLAATRDLVEELYRVDGKAEIINGKIVYFPMSGEMPVYAAQEVLLR